MAAGKENEAPAAPPTAVAARRRGLAIRKCGLKKRPVAKRLPCRVPLRDITNLVAATALTTELEVLPGLEDPDQVATLDAPPQPSTAVRNAVAGALTARAARYSLRKEFR